MFCKLWKWYQIYHILEREHQIPTEASLKTLCVHHSLELLSETYLIVQHL